MNINPNQQPQQPIHQQPIMPKMPNEDMKLGQCPPMPDKGIIEMAPPQPTCPPSNLQNNFDELMDFMNQMNEPQPLKPELPNFDAMQPTDIPQPAGPGAQMPQPPAPNLNTPDPAPSDVPQPLKAPGSAPTNAPNPAQTSLDPESFAQDYAQQNGISLEQAKQELEELYGKPQEQ